MTPAFVDLTTQTNDAILREGKKRGNHLEPLAAARRSSAGPRTLNSLAEKPTRRPSANQTKPNKKQKQARSPAPVGAAATTTPARVSSPSPALLRRGPRRAPLAPRAAAAARPAVAAAPAPKPLPGAPPAYLSKPNDQVRVLVAGPTGYIGKFVVKELVSRGYQVFALSRETAGVKGKLKKEDVERELAGATVVFGDPTDRDATMRLVAEGGLPGGVGPDVVVSCLASRTGGKKDSWRVDHDASKNVFDAGAQAGAQHLVLLSAICVQRPLLEFQRAKLALEQGLARMAQQGGDGGGSSSSSGNNTSTKAPPPSFSVVRPTAFFKSLAGQVALVRDGKPYVMFGDGTLAACKPISERDLASFIADCVRPSSEPSEGAPDGTLNAVLPIGGPGRALTARDQAGALFRLAAVKPNYFPVPVALMDGIISLLDLLTRFFPSMEDSAEFGRIGKYYATESMLVWDEAKNAYDADATPSYGADTLEAFFERALREGLAGQELGDQAVFGVNE
jgi:divinyl chlorophyllide a 8-vinyl-reductase